MPDNKEKNRIDYYEKYLPSINMIEDRTTAEAVCAVWDAMLEMSPWESVDEARFKEGFDNVSLISHVNSTIEAALSVSRIVNKYHQIYFDEQRIVVFGLLHDVDKVIEYAYNDSGELIKSEVAQKIQHGVMSAIVAHEKGFDMDMLHMILTHTTDSKLRPVIKEAILFNYIDLCDWDLTCRYAGL